MTTTTTIHAPDALLPLVLRPGSKPDDADFDEFCQQNGDLRVEQTRQGDWVIMAPMGFEAGSRNSEISRQLGN